MARPDLRLLPPDTDLLEFLLSLPPEERAKAVRALGFTQADALDRDWKSWAHEGQVEPAQAPDGLPWAVWVVMGGRGFGKTLTGSNWITRAIAEAKAPLRIALVGATLAEARSVMVEGRSGLMEVAGPWIREWRPSLGLLKFRTGAEATLFSGHSPELLRGPEHHLAWCDELAKWEKPGETWDMLQLGLRLGDRPRALVTTTPRPGPHLRRIMASPRCAVTGGPTRANPHLSPDWQQSMHNLYAGTRLARQELEGELLSDNPGALWTIELLEKCRILPGTGRGTAAEGGGGGGSAPGTIPTDSAPGSPPPPPCFAWSPSPSRGGSFLRIVIAVDPPSGAGTCGIIACAKDSEGRAHVLADHSVTARSPESWAATVAQAAAIHALDPPRWPGADCPAVRSHAGGMAAGPWEGDRSPQANGGGGSSRPPSVQIVAESNQGGLMVQSVLRIADPRLNVKLVTATQGKTDRAAPLAMLFESGKVALHGRFPELEAELCGMIAGGDYEGPGNSPDRADALVWALTELMLQPEKAKPWIYQL